MNKFTTVLKWTLIVACSLIGLRAVVTKLLDEGVRYEVGKVK
jgi:hypothetical protein